VPVSDVPAPEEAAPEPEPEPEGCEPDPLGAGDPLVVGLGRVEGPGCEGSVLRRIDRGSLVV
jgi:hypothetical protein